MIAEGVPSKGRRGCPEIVSRSEGARTRDRPHESNSRLLVQAPRTFRVPSRPARVPEGLGYGEHGHGRKRFTRETFL